MGTRLLSDYHYSYSTDKYHNAVFIQPFCVRPHARPHNTLISILFNSLPSEKSFVFCLFPLPLIIPRPPIPFRVIFCFVLYVRSNRMDEAQTNEMGEKNRENFLRRCRRLSIRQFTMTFQKTDEKRKKKKRKKSFRARKRETRKNLTILKRTKRNERKKNGESKWVCCVLVSRVDVCFGCLTRVWMPLLPNNRRKKSMSCVFFSVEWQ